MFTTVGDHLRRRRLGLKSYNKSVFSLQVASFTTVVGRRRRRQRELKYYNKLVRALSSPGLQLQVTVEDDDAGDD